jgi:myo-inositol 2-dehydrogenase/D-chiro-inositol 1-dehydrogenase
MLEIALIGAGRIGQIHGRNIAAHPGAKLRWVTDVNAEAAGKLAGALGAQSGTDAKKAIEDPAVKAVAICSSTDTHAEMIEMAAKAGKAIFCEKPIDLSLERVDHCLATVRKAGVTMMIGFNRRFDASFAAVHEGIRSGKIGKLETLIITSRDPAPPPLAYIATSGGIFRDMMIHDFDMARWLLGEEPTEVTAIASCLVDPGIGSAGDYDTLMVNMKTASGRQCHINNCRQSAYGYDQRLEVFGSRGMVLNDNLRPTTLRRYNESETEAREPLLNFFLERYADGYRIELDSFVDAAEAGGPMPVTIRDGRQALRLADAALESAGSGRTVRV